MRIPIQYATDPTGDVASEPRPRESSRLELVLEGNGEEETPRVALEQATPKEAAPKEADSESRLARELDRALRSADRHAADFDNYRRHAEAKLTTARTDAAVEVLAELGDALRSLELAVASADQGASVQAVSNGVTLVVRGLESVFSKHGLQRIPTRGHPFDPRLHDAMMTEPSDEVEKGTVVRELSPGFRTEDRVVRPAKVVVSS
jgi:molecular chaperone GrpE